MVVDEGDLLKTEGGQFVRTLTLNGIDQTYTQRGLHAVVPLDIST